SDCSCDDPAISVIYPLSLHDALPISIHASFAALQRSLEEMSKKTATIAEQSKKGGGPSEQITLAVANRLFAQSGYDFRSAFRELDRKSTRLNSSHGSISYAVFCLTKK